MSPTSTWRESRSTESGGSSTSALLEDEHLDAGDWVLIHVGFAMSKIDEEEASARPGLLADDGRDVHRRGRRHDDLAVHHHRGTNERSERTMGVIIGVIVGYVMGTRAGDRA